MHFAVINVVLSLCVLQTTVPANRNTVILQNLTPDTPYNIKVMAVYPDGPGGDIAGDGRTGTHTHACTHTQTPTTTTNKHRQTHIILYFTHLHTLILVGHTVVVGFYIIKD